jgi:hypothetical protein
MPTRITICRDAACTRALPIAKGCREEEVAGIADNPFTFVERSSSPRNDDRRADGGFARA